jgi:FixJ family two-component response regulator
MDLERDRPKVPDNSTVCIVDDDQAVLAALRSLLTAEGYAVRAHESAQAFLDMIQQDDCGCLVTDVRLPGMSGLDLLAKMKERRVSMPVIVARHCEEAVGRPKGRPSEGRGYADDSLIASPRS